MRMKLVTINGPLGVGKSWTANRVCELTGGNTGRVIVEFVSFQDCLRNAAMALVGLSESQVSYDAFKKTNYYGRTGREWMIEMSERFCKAHDPVFFSRVMHDTMRRRAMRFNKNFKYIFIADSNGFESELDYFRVQDDVDLLATSIEPEGSAPRGTPWIEGDSRFNLAHKCSLVHEDSTTMAHAIVKALETRGWV